MVNSEVELFKKPEWEKDMVLNRVSRKKLEVHYSYGSMLTRYRDYFPTIRLQTVNLSIGYVYTFKKKDVKSKEK